MIFVNLSSLQPFYSFNKHCFLPVLVMRLVYFKCFFVSFKSIVKFVHLVCGNDFIIVTENEKNRKVRIELFEDIHIVDGKD